KYTFAFAVLLLVIPAIVRSEVGARQDPILDASKGKADGGSERGVAYKLVVQHSGKCLDVPSSSQDNLVALTQYACYGTPNQRFVIRPMRDNYVEIVAQHSQKCLDVLNGSTADLAPTGQFDCHGGDNQLFRFSGNPNEGLTIVAKNSSKCLDVLSSSVADG